MSNTFSEQLVRFVQAVDYIDDRNFDQIRLLADNYAMKTLNIQITRLMVATRGKDRTVLQAYGLAKKRQYYPIDVWKRDGQKNVYGGQTAYAFDNQEPLWIISAHDDEEDELIKCSNYQNKWNPNQLIGNDFPRYNVTTREPIRTSIIIPLKDNANQIFGVFNFETTDRLQITDMAKRELKNIAYALATAYQTNLSTNTNLERTSKSLATLGTLLQKPLPKLTKPKIFLASSARADPKVIDAVMEVLNLHEITKLFEVVYWKDMNNPGNINQHLINELSSCRFGICYLSEELSSYLSEELSSYLSEELSSSDYSYQDNPNVVFEAGMLHGRSDPDSPRPASWIPIREEKSPTPPFDIASERMIHVPRDKNGELEVDVLKKDLLNRLHNLETKC